MVSPILSRLYTPEEFGLVAIYLGILSVINSLSTGTYEQAIMLPKKSNSAYNLFGLVISWVVIFSLMTLTIAFFAGEPLTLLSGNPDLRPWLYWLPLSVLFYGVFKATTFFANRFKLYNKIALSTISQNFTLNGTRLVIGWFPGQLNGLVVGQIAGQGIAAFYMIARLRRQLLQTLSSITVKRMLVEGKKYSAYPKYNMIQGVMSNLSSSLPVLLFSWGFSPHVAGLYGFAYMFVFKPVNLFSQSLQQVFQQRIIEQFNQGESVYKPIKQTVIGFALAGILPFLALGILATPVFEFVFSEDYGSSGFYVSLLTPWLFMVFITSHLSFLPELFFRQRKAMFINLTTLTLRASALFTGVFYQDVTLSLILFSGVSTLMLLYTLGWYLYLVKEHGSNGG